MAARAPADHGTRILAPSVQQMAQDIVIPAIGADGASFPMEKLAAHHTGQLHWAISVFVFSGAKILVQKRAATKYHCAGQWANACCSHPHWREGLGQSAHRRVREELGVSLPLIPTRIIEYHAQVGPDMVEHERVQIFRADVDDRRTHFHPNPDEVESLRWATLDCLRQEVRQTPGHFAPWFRIYLARWSELGLEAAA